MAKTYGQDLRERVMAAVQAGASRRAAAKRFEVGVSTAIGWVRAWFEEGRNTAKPTGGDTRSHRIEAHRIEAHRDAILGAIEAQPEIRLAELAARLEREPTARFAPNSVHRFLVRQRITLQKRRRMPVNKRAPTWHGAGRPGSTASPTLIPSG
jgi:transposase